uniref:Phospholipase A2 n=1 Tax=Sparus aurata TaxID=8175 RepID=A0A671UBF6_SPAAU
DPYLGSRAFWQFGNMIRCVQPGVNPFKYNNYGSYCGLRRRGTPVDEVDLCCKVHDECYAAQMRNPRCRGFFSQPYRYQYSCSGDGGKKDRLCPCGRPLSVQEFPIPHT